MTRFGPVRSNPSSQSQMRLRLIHQDQVNPNSLPDDFINVGRSELCEIQGVYKRGRVFTLQGHPEFDAEVMVEFGKPILGTEEVQAGPDDSMYAAHAILKFLCEEADEEKVAEAAPPPAPQRPAPPPPAPLPQALGPVHLHASARTRTLAEIAHETAALQAVNRFASNREAADASDAADREVAQDDTIERLILSFERLTVCGYSLVLESCL